MAERQDTKPTGQQPEALRSLEAAAKAGSQTPDGQGLEAHADTAPKSAPLEAEQKDAAEILNGGASGSMGPNGDAPR